MGQDPVWKLLVRFSTPTIISMMVASSYNIVDAIFVGRLGPLYVALALVQRQRVREYQYPVESVRIG